MISFNEKPFVEKHATKIVAAFTIIGSGVAAYFGCRKAVCEAANAVIGVVQNMQAQPQQAAPVQAEAAVEITEEIAKAIEEKADGKEEPKAEAAPSDSTTNKVVEEENK